MSKMLIILCIFVFVVNCNASDTIYLTNNSTIEGKVTKIDLETVTVEYGENNLIRTLHKSEIKVIIFEDGTAETFPVMEATENNELKTKLQNIEEKSNQNAVENAKSKGVMFGIGFVCIIILFAAMVA
jgi:hypothetical protein